MADGDLNATGMGTDTLLALNAGEDGVVSMPEGLSLSDATFSMNGDDLVVSWPDGTQASVEGFGGSDTPTLIDGNGAEMSGDMAFQMAQLDSPSDVSSDLSFEGIGDAFVGTDGLIGGTDGTPIGTVDDADGAVWAIRVDGTRVELHVGDPVFQGDILESGADGSVGIVLADDTTFSMGEDGRMVLDEMVYDPATQEGSVNVSVLEGVFTFVSGQVAKTDPDAMSIDTPVATIGIRGTQVGINLSEDKGMDIVLMEEGDGFVGEVVLENDGGVEILNTANAASKVLSFDTPPAQSFTIDTVQLLQSFGNALKALPGLNNANTYGADSVELEQLIQDAIDEQEAAIEQEIQEAEDEAAAEDEAEAEIEEAEAEAEAEDAEAKADDEAEIEEEFVEAMLDQAAAEAEDQQDAVDDALDSTDPNDDGSDDEDDINIVLQNDSDTIPTFELVDYDIDEDTQGNDVILGNTLKDTVLVQDDSSDDVIVVDVDPEPEPDPVADLIKEVGTKHGLLPPGALIKQNSDGSFSISGNASESISLDLSALNKRFKVSGGSGADSVILGSGNDSVNTGDGDDYIYAGDGNDFVNAGAGNDVLQGGTGRGDDTYIGGAGVDWMIYPSAKEGFDLLINIGDIGLSDYALPNGDIVSIDAQSATDADPSSPWIDNDTLIEIENVLAGEGDDVVIGSDADNILIGNLGDDYLFGGAGDDILIGGTDGFFDGTGTPTDGGSDVLIGGEGFDAVIYGGIFGNYEIGYTDDGFVTVTSLTDGSVDKLSEIEVITFGDGQTLSIGLPPTLNVSASAGDEDAAIALNIVATTENAGDAINSITIEGIPEGAIITVGTDEIVVSGGQAVIPGALLTFDESGNIQNLTITPPLNNSDDFVLTVTATTVLGAVSTDETFAVNVTPVADAPNLTVSFSPFGSTDPDIQEGDLVSLDVSAFTTDSSENISNVTVSGLPTGTKVFVDMGGGVLFQLPASSGSVSIPPSLADQIVLSLPEDFTGDLNLQVSATSKESNGDTATTTQSVTIPVEALADDFSIVATNASGSEDTDIPLNIQLDGLDAADATSVSITGIPEGSVITAGTDEYVVGVDGNVTIPASVIVDLAAQGETPTLTPPADYSGNFTMLVTATSADLTTDPVSVGVQVTGVADAPTVTVGTISGAEDTSIPLDIDIDLADTDGSEAITSITLSGIPDGATVTAGGDAFVVINGSVSLSPAQLESLELVPAENFSGAISLSLSVTSTESNGDSATTVQTFTVDVTEVIDAPDVAVQAATGAEDSAIPLDVSATVDGGEDLVSVTISDIPAGAKLSVGTDQVVVIGGTAILTPDQLDGLTITPPEDSNVDFDLTVTATSSDGGVSEAVSLSVDVTGVADAANITVNDVSGDAGEAIPLNVGINLADADGSESVSSVQIGGLPAGAIIRTDAGDLQPVNGVVSIAGGSLAGVSVIPPVDYTGEMDLTVSVTTEENDGDSTTATESFTVTVEGANEPPAETPPNTEDMVTIDLNVLSSLHFDEGQSIADVTEITISDVPDGAILTAGTDLGEGVWVLGPGDLEGLQIALDPDVYLDEDMDGEDIDFSLDVSASIDGDEPVTGEIEIEFEDDQLIVGSDGADVISAGANAEAFGLAGDDFMVGLMGGSEMHGGSGDDLMIGGTGSDVLHGNSGNDVLFGGKGSDELYGGAGDDILLGGKGSDILMGGAGDDTLSGGQGADTFIFDADSGTDIITDIITDIMSNDTIVFEGSEFHAEDMIFREAEDGDVEISFANNPDVSVKLDGVHMDDINTETHEGYSVTETDGKLSVTIDGGDGQS